MIRQVRMMSSLLFLLLFLASCGYQVKSDEVNFGVKKEGNIKLFIPVVDNLTTQSGFEVALTNSLRSTLSGLKGLDIVDGENEADFILLSQVNQLTKKANPRSNITGTEGTESQGGLKKGQQITGSYTLTMDVNIRLIEKIPNASLNKRVWTKDISAARDYESSRRFSYAEGSNSVANINQSRELLLYKLLSDDIARKILWQVSNDF